MSALWEGRDRGRESGGVGGESGGESRERIQICNKNVQSEGVRRVNMLYEGERGVLIPMHSLC